MKQIHSVDKLRKAIAEWREAGDTIALVPTMGNLHKGHMSLISLAAEYAEHVIVSIFVNPTQFGPNEDYTSYPRPLEVDSRKLVRAGIDILFAPSVEEMYPRGLENSARVLVPEISEQLCGASRPGHFMGVTSVVSRLFNICRPDVAVFGSKDYQQLVILRQMVEGLHIPVKLLAGETERDANGLALSSRNEKLDDAQRATAAVIFRALEDAAIALRAGQSEFVDVEKTAIEKIAAAGLDPEYVAIRNATDLSMPQKNSPRLAILAAAHLSDVRLIDNVLVNIDE
ncbi:MAG: pantoate--beta-alanine ligase [Gammaproteobacteria bacterium]|nr:MAG: pantoate--beta-alanine ligase [Gammaproteobacteria bacterium]